MWLFFSGPTKPACEGQGQGDGLQADAVHQGLLPWQLHLPLAHQQQQCQVRLVLAQFNHLKISRLQKIIAPKNKGLSM